MKRKRNKRLNNLIVLQTRGKALKLNNCFRRVIKNFLVDYRKDEFVIFETIILSSTILEAIIKELLSDINPSLVLKEIQADLVAILSNKKEKLIKQSENNFDGCYASLSELKKRFSLFYKIQNYQKDLDDFIKIRNSLIHYTSKKNPIDEGLVTLALTRSVFPFIYQYVDLSKTDWNKILQYQKTAHDNIATLLRRKIEEWKPKISKYGAKAKSKLINTPYPCDKYQNEQMLCLKCPACKNLSTSLIIENEVLIDLEVGKVFTICKVCYFKLDQFELETFIKFAKPLGLNVNEKKKWNKSISDIILPAKEASQASTDIFVSSKNPENI